MTTKYTLKLNKIILFSTTLLLALGFLFKAQERVFTFNSNTGVVLATFNPTPTTYIKNNTKELEYSQVSKKLESLNVDQQKVNKVRAYLAGRRSPLAAKAEYLVKMAEEFGIDYRLVAAISIIESSGGIHTYRPYNAWGWGGAAGAFTFKNWEEAIYTVSRGLSRYYAAGLTTPRLIAPRYNPHTPGEWSRKVEYVMSQM